MIKQKVKSSKININLLYWSSFSLNNLFDLSVFANVPDQLKGEKQTPTARDAEHALRDVGYTHKQAKKILADGLTDGLRDEDPPIDPPPVVKTQRDAESDIQRDVEDPPKKKDKTADLLTRGEVLAPARYTN